MRVIDSTPSDETPRRQDGTLSNVSYSVSNESAMPRIYGLKPSMTQAIIIRVSGVRVPPLASREMALECVIPIR